jgi:hypothetical protein
MLLVKFQIKYVFHVIFLPSIGFSFYLMQVDS